MFTLFSAGALFYTVHESQTVGGVMSYQANISWVRMDVPKVEVKPYEHRQLLLQITRLLLFCRFFKEISVIYKRLGYYTACIRSKFFFIIFCIFFFRCSNLKDFLMKVLASTEKMMHCK